MQDSSVAHPPASPPTSERRPSRWSSRGLPRRLVVGLLLAALALGAAAGLAMLTAPTSTITGTVGGFGWGGGGCYPTVSYVVDGRSYTITEDQGQEWCTLQNGGPAVVHYDPSDPGEGRLARYGDLPWLLARLALGALVLAGLAATAAPGRARDRSTHGAAPAPVTAPVSESVSEPVTAPVPPTTATPGTTRSRAAHRLGRRLAGWGRGWVHGWRRSWGRIPRVFAGLLLLGWVLASVAVVLVGERSSSLSGLDNAISQGEVDVVQAAGGLDAGSKGSASVQLHWSHGGIGYRTEVVQVRGRPGGSLTGDDEVTGQIRGDLAAHFTRDGAPVRVERVGGYRTSTEVHLAGWRVTGWFLWPFAGLLVLTLRMLVVSPEPWGSTRWAWFWLIVLLPPFGALLYLLWGGPAVIPRRTPPPGRRFGGGWALVLGYLLSGMF